jgi:hypothetical protein
VTGGRRRRALTIGAGVVLVLLVAGTVLAAQGSRTTYDRGDGAAPDWTRPCFRRPPRTDRPLLHFCARVTGRVLHVRHTHPDTTHVAVLAHFGIVIVRVESPDTSGFGSTITAVGPMLRVKYGLHEVQAFDVG